MEHSKNMEFTYKYL